ncbi:MAG: RNA polymerase sigma factor [Chloroflexota bacterium]
MSNQHEPLFNQLYEAHYSSIYAYFLGQTGDAERSLDLLQETFVRAWRHMPKLVEMQESQHQYWLFSVAKNLYTDSLRRTIRWQKIESDMVSTAKQHVVETSTPGEQDAMSLQTQLIVLEEAMTQLPENLRVVLSMNVLGGMNSKQIGEALEIPDGTVRYRLSTARKKLVEFMEAQ